MKPFIYICACCLLIFTPVISEAKGSSIYVNRSDLVCLLENIDKYLSLQKKVILINLPKCQEYYSRGEKLIDFTENTWPKIKSNTELKSHKRNAGSKRPTSIISFTKPQLKCLEQNGTKILNQSGVLIELPENVCEI